MSNPHIVDDQADEEYEAAMADLYARRYSRELTRHPSCADPDHPGCPDCWEETKNDCAAVS